MKRKELKRIVAGRLANIQDILSRILIASGEDIHKLRTNYKKLRSLLRLARRGAGGGKDLRLSAGLKQLYHSAGELRSLQLHYKHLAPFVGHNHYLEDVTERVQRAKLTLLQQSQYFDANAELKRLKSQLPEKISPKTLRKFIGKKEAAINRDAQINDENLHTDRKLLKDITYAVEETNAKPAKYFPLAGKKDLGELKELSDKLNAHQDLAADLSLLHSSYITHLPLADKTKLAEVEHNWLEKKRAVREEVLFFL